MILRRAIHAGSWYEGSEKNLKKSLDEFFSDNKFGPGELPQSLNQEKRTILGGVSPHAGHRYSACCSAWTFLNLFKEKIPDTVIVLGTDHIGFGKVALMEEGQWETPLGNLTIDTELSREILKNSKVIIGDDSAFTGYFEREHNIEIQLPFIKYCAGEKDVNIIPFKVSTKKFNIIDQLSSDIASAIKLVDKDVVIVASSDMTHKQPSNYMNPEKDLEDMRERDQAVIDAFKEFNPELTYNTALKTSVCGPQTITSLMLICKKLGAIKCRDLKYYTSYQKGGGTGPCEYSVGYFSGIISTN